MTSDQRNPASDEVSEDSKFLSVLDASLESFIHKALKDIQIECIHKIVCRGRDVLAVLLTGLGKSPIYQLIPKVLFRMTPHQNHCRNPCFFGLQSETVPALSDTLVAE